MATVLDDVTSETIDASDIQRRISNWEERLNELYKKINDWLPEDWQGPKGSPVNMHEKLMKNSALNRRRCQLLFFLTGRMKP